MSSKRVLIVEDHALTRGALRRVFAREGWDVRAVGTLAEALAALDPPPDCVVLDLVLSDGPGEEILQRIHADRLSPHVVAITTGVIDPARLVEASKLQPSVLLQKPIDPEILYRLCLGQAGE